MRRSRALLGLAIVAVLWGAPRSVSAVTDELSSPPASRDSGSVTTTLSFRARDEAGAPVTLLTVAVAGAIPGPRGLGADGERDDVVSDVLIGGLAGVASVAIIGMLLLLAGRRRATGGAAARPAPSAAHDALIRRVTRTGRVHAADDPIVAALGVDHEMAARRAIRQARRRIRDQHERPVRHLTGR